MMDEKTKQNFKHACLKSAVDIMCVVLRNRGATQIEKTTYDEIFKMTYDMFHKGIEVNYLSWGEK